MDRFTDKMEELKAEGVVTRAVVCPFFSRFEPSMYRIDAICAPRTGSCTDSGQILCNPQNPLGRTYPRSTLIAYAKWCEANDVHLVSDEIYAMSVYDSPNPATGKQEGFTSLMSLREGELGEGYDRARLHGMSIFRARCAAFSYVMKWAFQL